MLSHKFEPVDQPIMTLHYLVTGGAGFIGSHLVTCLMNAGHKVTVLDDLSTGSHRNIHEWESNPNFTFLKGNVIDPIDIQVDRIFHLACPASPPQYQADPLKTIRTCIIGTQNMLELARRYDARMVYTSTSEVYGDPNVNPQPEEYWGYVNCRGPRSCYDEGKRAAETLVYCYIQEYATKVRTARIFNTYGPNMHPEDGRVVSNMIMQALEGKDLTIYGDGKQTRSFGYVSDTVRALLALMDTDYEGAINIGNPGEFTILQLAQLVQQKVNPDVKIVFKPAAADDPRQRKPDITKAGQILKWEPQVTLEEGLDKTIPYFREIVEARKLANK
jgi:UDP-glucuronate decarboxylase